MKTFKNTPYRIPARIAGSGSPFFGGCLAKVSRTRFSFLGFLALLAVGISFLSMVRTADADLISHYTFDASTLTGAGLGATYANEIGGVPVATVADDAVGTGPTSVAGMLGQAASFDGNGNYLDSTLSGLPNNTSGMGVGTVAFWIRSDAVDGLGNDTVMATFNTGTTTAFAVDFNDGPIDDFRVFARGEGGDSLSVDTADVLSNWNDGAWHHIAVTWNQESAADSAIYFDGVSHSLNGANLAPGETYAAWEFPMTIGALNNRGTLQAFLEGDLDDLRVYDNAFDDGGIQRLLGVAVPTLTINRDTGELTLTNDSGSPIPLLGYSMTSGGETLNPAQWTSISENYDSDNPGPDQVDSDDTWQELTAPAAHGDLSEFELGGSGPNDGGVLGVGQSISLGVGAWTQSPLEDIEMFFIQAGGANIPVIEQYTGNGGEAFGVGDFDFDGDVDRDDYTIFLSNLDTSLAGSSLAEAYLSGDLNNDLENNFVDALLFREAFDSVNGPGAFNAMIANVPEPSSVLLLGIGGAALLLGRRKNRKLNGILPEKTSPDTRDNMPQHSRPSVLLSLALLLCFFLTSSAANAAITYLDAIEGAAPGRNTTILGGADFNSTAANAADGLWRGRGFGNGTTIFESNAGGAESAHMLATTISGLDAGDSYNVYSYFWSDPGNWRLKSTIDASDIDDNATPANFLDDFLANDPSVSFSSQGSAQSTTAPAAVAGDFVVAPIVSEGNRILHQASLGLVQANGSGEIVVYIDDREEVNRSWYDGVGYDKFLQLTLEINTDTGASRILNSSGDPLEIDYYKITSPSNALDFGNWISLDDQNLDAVDGDDPGTIAGDSSDEGWGESGGSNDGLLSEFFLEGSTTFADGDSASLGSAFEQSTGNSAGLEFEFLIAGRNTLTPGIISLVTGFGDMNADGVVDDLDVNPFVQALTDRAAFEAAHPGVDADTVGDFNSNGSLDLGDIAGLKAALSVPGSAGGNQVPEPSALILVGVALVGLVSRTRRNTRSCKA